MFTIAVSGEFDLPGLVFCHWNETEGTMCIVHSVTKFYNVYKDHLSPQWLTN